MNVSDDVKKILANSEAKNKVDMSTAEAFEDNPLLTRAMKKALRKALRAKMKAQRPEDPEAVAKAQARRDKRNQKRLAWALAGGIRR